MHVHAHTRAHMHTHTHMYTHTHTHTHTHTTRTCTHWQGVVWRRATVGWMYTNHTSGSAEAFWVPWFLLPSSASPWGGPTRCRHPRSGEEESCDGKGEGKEEKERGEEREGREGRGEEREESLEGRGEGREEKTCRLKLDKKLLLFIVLKVEGSMSWITRLGCKWPIRLQHLI